jgi:hypothetical protein
MFYALIEQMLIKKRFSTSVSAAGRDADAAANRLFPGTDAAQPPCHRLR